MNGFFSIDSPFFRFCAKIADIFLLNLIFVVTCIPVVTIGAALTSLHTISMKMVSGKEGYIIKGYWQVFCASFKKATVHYLLLLLAGGILGVDFYFWSRIAGSIGVVMRIVTVVAAFLCGMVALYIFPLLSTGDYSLGEGIKKAFLLSLYRLPVTVLLFVYVGIISWLAVSFLVVDFFLVLFGFGLAAMGSAVLYRVAFKTIITDQE